jgi:hypothetical protein
VDSAERTALAWSLADIAKASLPPEARTWLCVKIGSGEQEEAIYELLRTVAHFGIDLPARLLAPLRDWASGYVGSDKERRLGELLVRLHAPDLLEPTCGCTRCPMSTPRRPPGRHPQLVPGTLWL